MKKSVHTTLQIGGAILLIAAAVLAIIAICSITVPAKSEGYYGEENWVAAVTDELLYDYPTYNPETVKAIQTELNRYLSKKLSGYHRLTIDGIFGPSTATAVKDYQRLKKMSTDGIVGPATAKVMGVEIEENIYYAPCLAEAFASSRNGKAAHLNLRSHLLEIYFHYEDGWELVNIIKCSTGNQKKGYYTPVGITIMDGETHGEISGKDSNGDGIADWKADNATKFSHNENGKFFFHSVLRKWNSAKGKWEYDKDSTLGKSITHGCVRLSREDAKWIRKNLTAGTVVVVDDRNWDNSAIIAGITGNY